MEFIVNTSLFSEALETLAPFMRAYPQTAARDILVEVRGSAGHLAAERAGHRIVSSSFPISGATSDLSVLVPFRIASGISDIDEQFASADSSVAAHMRIEDRNGRRVFSYSSCGATGETLARPPAPSEVPSTRARAELGEVDPATLLRALELTASAVDFREHVESHKVIDFVQLHGIASAVVFADHEVVVVQARGLATGLRVHLSTAPLLKAFLRKASGRVTVATCGTHVFIEGASGSSFAFPMPVGESTHATVPVAPAAPTDVRVCADVKQLVKALTFLTHESPDRPARAAVTPDGDVRLSVRESDRSNAHVHVSFSFLTKPCDVSFGFNPGALHRFLRTYDTDFIELRLTMADGEPGATARVLSATHTSSDGTVTVHRFLSLLR